VVIFFCSRKKPNRTTPQQGKSLCQDTYLCSSNGGKNLRETCNLGKGSRGGNQTYTHRLLQGMCDTENTVSPAINYPRFIERTDRGKESLHCRKGERDRPQPVVARIEKKMVEYRQQVFVPREAKAVIVKPRSRNAVTRRREKKELKRRVRRLARD